MCDAPFSRLPIWLRLWYNRSRRGEHLSYGQAKDSQAHFFLKTQEHQRQEYGEPFDRWIQLFA